MKDKKILKELRNGPMKSMKDDEYAMIEEEVNQKGISGLKGYAKSMIEKAMREMAYSMKDTVKKHGEHDQASHGNWATGGMGGAESDLGGYKAEARRDDAADEANSRDAKNKEQVLSSNRSDKKVSEIAAKLSELSDKMRTKTSNPYTKDDNIKAADKLKAISEKLTEAASADTSSFRHFELMQQAYDAIDKLDSAIFSNAGAGRSFDSITMQASDYLTKVDDDLFYMNKAVSVKSGDMVSWNSSGGSASGKVVRVISSGKINVPDSSFSIEGTEDDPAALIQLYRDGKPTETKVGHKVSTLKKK